MRAWYLDAPAPGGTGLRLGTRADPVPGPGELLIEVSACGVCRTDLHVAEGDLPPRTPRIIPGHEVVGVVRALGPGARRFTPGERVGVPWLAGTCGVCRWCRRGRENLCPNSVYTGWDVPGGYADLAVAAEAYVYRLPQRYSDQDAAPLLCAGIIGYRALKRAEVPPGGRLGIYGFGGSAHLTIQVAVARGTTVHVLTRGAAARELALRLGAASAGDAYDAPPEPLDSAIVFAPVGDLVPVALAALDRGGTLAVAGIHLTDIPVLNYQAHLFQERTLRSVTANTRADGEEFLSVAGRIDLEVSTTPYPFDRADRALDDLAAGRMRGAGVLLAGSAG